jgi:hypothetical protein
MTTTAHGSTSLFQRQVKRDMSVSRSRATRRLTTVKQMAARPETRPMTAAGATASTCDEISRPTCGGGVGGVGVGGVGGGGVDGGVGVQVEVWEFLP